MIACWRPAALPDDLWTRWNVDPLLIAALAPLTLTIACGRASNAPAGWGAVALMFIVFVLPLCAAASALFSARALHHVLLIDVPAFADFCRSGIVDRAPRRWGIGRTRPSTHSSTSTRRTWLAPRRSPRNFRVDAEDASRTVASPVQATEILDQPMSDWDGRKPTVAPGSSVVTSSVGSETWRDRPVHDQTGPASGAARSSQPAQAWASNGAPRGGLVMLAV